MGMSFPTSAAFTASQSNSSHCEIQDGFLAVTLPVMYSLIFISGLLSNMLALWVFWCHTQRSTSITVYMRNLALSDLLLSLCLPFRVAYQNQSGPLILCTIVGAFFYLNMYVSIMFLSLISLDRYLKIIRPLRQFKIHTVPCSTLAARVVWLAYAVFTLPFFFETRGAGACADKCFHFRSKRPLGAALNLVAVATFFIHLLLFLYFYGKISAKLQKVSSGKAQQQGRRPGSRAITRTVVVLAIFSVCFAPYHAVRVPYVLAQLDVISSTQWKQALHLANELVLCISALNSCLDPVIFFFFSSSFRRAVHGTIHGKLKRVVLRNQGALNHSKSITEPGLE
ncbi:putative G-protein coupled receptor 34 [Pelodiscus sinensis]|uniref:putative G-protein coupled receptor 34 n=1 Tax=Pelodiscus sinensis TaxID=13735 RepID=UPI0003C44744|nr:probable G-protein coupled receptor 34 [Pelodiscus sinensis]|eukprot:XP_006111422.1 probable G-protein coupled receptor 34 [Pelodiscus sinensis]